MAMSIADRAKRLYESELKVQMERDHGNRYLAIEPISQEYFLGDTFIAAAMAAKSAYPDRQPFVLRVGHEAAFHIGATLT
jgi:hypothetical protein